MIIALLLINGFVFFFVLLLCEGTQMALSRYLFAVSCFQMDLLSEAETALSPANERGAEVVNVSFFKSLFSEEKTFNDRSFI